MRFRDLFALVIWLSSLLVYLLAALGYSVPEVVVGQLLTIDALVVQFYFRKRPRGEAESRRRET